MTQPPEQQQQQSEQQPDQQQQSDSGQSGQQQKPDNEPRFTQADINRLEATFKREYQSKRQRDEELIEKGKRLEQQEQEQQPLSERVTALSAESAQKDSALASKDTQILRMQLAWDAGLPPAIGRRVQGNTEDEIKADIESLKADLTASGTVYGQGSGLRPNPQQGAPSTNNDRTGSLSAGRDLWSKRHGKKTDAAT